jgi:hypothetical protein
MERILLAVFLTCMPLTAAIILALVWFGNPDAEVPHWIFKITATSFILGLASFLVWFVHVAHRYTATSN